VDPRIVRRVVLERARHAGVGHIGSALSIVDLLVALYDRILAVPDPHDSERDRFVLSKGHGALALYAVLAERGWLSPDLLETYCADGTLLGVHPEHALPGIDFSTGSLGQGLGFGAGAALAARLDGSPRRAFVLLSDAECNEGAVWEAVMWAAHHRLSNLVAIVDLNGQQALGYTRDVMNLDPMADRWRAFGWDVHEVDGHDVSAIAATCARLECVDGPPHVLLASTTFGRGVPFMESIIDWHYLPMTEEQFQSAVQGLGENS
jgi:transketolase